MVGSLTWERSQSDASWTFLWPVAARAWQYYIDHQSSIRPTLTFSALGLENPIWVSVSRGERFCLWILVGVGFFLGGSVAAILRLYFCHSQLCVVMSVSSVLLSSYWLRAANRCDLREEWPDTVPGDHTGHPHCSTQCCVVRVTSLVITRQCDLVWLCSSDWTLSHTVLSLNTSDTSDHDTVWLSVDTALVTTLILSADQDQALADTDQAVIVMMKIILAFTLMITTYLTSLDLDKLAQIAFI